MKAIPRLLILTAATAAAVTLSWAPGDLPAQEPEDLPFDSGSTGADGDLVFPPAVGWRARYGHVAAYDPTADQIVVAAGYSRANAYLSDGWVWTDGQWTEGPAFPQDPYYRTYLMEAVYDAAGSRVVVFGGRGNQSNASIKYSNAVVAWNGATWSSVSTSGTPSGRQQHVLVYDAERGETVLFGGWRDSVLGDTHTLVGTAWTDESPATSPPARYASAGAFDAARSEVVIFGGNNGSQRLGDTWTWDGADWTEESPGRSPSPRSACVMAYDAARGEVVLFGGADDEGVLDETWVWDGSTWTERNPTRRPPARNLHQMVYDSTREQVVLLGGNGAGSTDLDDMWAWDGADWTLIGSPSSLVFDMSDKPDGVYHYRRIEIPSGTTLSFRKNAANSPVTWLASGDVVINGTLSLDGSNGSGGNASGNNAPGGPGGFAGGLGGQPFEQVGTYAGTPGLGPGGGRAGRSAGQYGGHGTYVSSYGNAYILPLLGGSGGGGGGSTDMADGGNGGGGGGAILIGSSKGITLNGAIRVNGGNGENAGTYNASSTGPFGGGGSGGAIRLVADRISGSGSLEATGGWGGSSNRGSNAESGRIRIEAFLRPFTETGTDTPTASVSVPLDLPLLSQSSPALAITQIAGKPVAQPPTGSFSNPDVVFTESGEIQIRVEGTNVPDGTPVTAKVVTGSQSIDLPGEGEPEVLMAGGVATFTTMVEPGVGTVQAFVSFTEPVAVP